MVTHLKTHENREPNDYLCQENHFEALFRPTSGDFVPSVERNSSSINQMHYEETLMIDMALRSQSNSSATSSYSYQSNSTPVASSNKQSPTLFGSALSRRHKAISLTTKPYLNPLGIKCLTSIKR